ncbi:MAG: T9SS type A sorting domain-containing protein [Bacteroidota bacterium]|nr:T9SS type A sorting domain-containing protein [Bacteroidota bacterium]
MGVSGDPIPVTVSEQNSTLYLDIILKDGAVLLSLEENNNSIKMDNIYPNPVIDNVNININSKDNQQINIIIFNEIGQSVTNTQQSVQIGNNLLDINTSDLPHGLYQLIIRDKNGNTVNKKFIK